MRNRNDRTHKSGAKAVMPASWMNPESDALFDVILGLKNRAEARNFFRDLLTEKEILEFGRRWKAAKMLADGKGYVDIENATGMSSTTIARINQWLLSGMGGYRAAITKSHHTSSLSRRGLS